MKPFSRSSNSFVLHIFLTTLLFACTSGMQTAQNPQVHPTSTKLLHPINTQTAQPTISSESGNNSGETFSLQDASTIAPDDILKEITFGGAGGGGPCTNYLADYSKPVFDEAEPYFKINPQQVEWLDGFNIVICGLKEGEIVNGTVIDPEGNTFETSKIADWYIVSFTPTVMFGNEFGLKEKIGEYSFLFTTDNAQLRYSLTVVLPPGPRLYPIFYDQDPLPDAYYLYGYSSNERVRLMLYKDGALQINFSSWKEDYVDANGQLLINMSGNDDSMLFAVGDLSGLNQNAKHDIMKKQDSSSSDFILCNSSLSSRLHVGEYAYVATDPPQKNRVRKDAGTDNPIIGYIETGNAMKILEGPKCSNGWAWWKVQSIKNPNVVGWTAEGDDVYWLIPCNTLSSCP